MIKCERCGKEIDPYDAILSRNGMYGYCSFMCRNKAWVDDPKDEFWATMQTIYEESMYGGERNTTRELCDELKAWRVTISPLALPSLFPDCPPSSKSIDIPIHTWGGIVGFRIDIGYLGERATRVLHRGVVIEQLLLSDFDVVAGRANQ